MYGEERRIATVTVTVEIAMKTSESVEELKVRLADHILDQWDVIEVDTGDGGVPIQTKICQPEEA